MHRILTHHRLNRLSWLDRPTGTVIRRYEHAPGEPIQFEVNSTDDYSRLTHSGIHPDEKLRVNCT
ncbi:hypothetical protein GCM10010315_38190 [Streptomyces luteosporeus]|uniref:Uncharacterized protein n=1 Tax=Streptomyces luteosporeus TaxID=173856 RepID=A0ABP6G9U9_9ACTN